MKPVIKEALLKDKLMFKISDAEDFEELKYSFIYEYGGDVFSTIELLGDIALLPANAIEKVNVLNLVDNRNNFDFNSPMLFTGSLRHEQDDAINKFCTPHFKSGLLQAPPGWGKTYASTALIARYQKPTLILCHTGLLFNQWLDSLNTLTSGVTIGLVGDGKFNIQPITVGLYKSVHNSIGALWDKFSLLLVDEAHLSPAEMFSTTVNNINTRYRIAITATPSRKDGRHLVLPDYFGSFKVEAKDSRKLAQVTVEIVQSGFPFLIINVNRDWTTQLTKLGENSGYLELIARHAQMDIAKKRCLLILSERVEMLRQLQQRIPNSVLLIGETSNDERERILKNAGNGIDAILSTKIFDEGISCHRLDTLYLTCPSNNPVKLEQRIGRIQREHPEKQDPMVKDFWLNGNIVKSQQTRRAQWYQAKGYRIKIIK